MKKNPKEITVIIPSSLKELSRIERLAGKIAREMNLSEDQQDNFSIAVTEAVGNAIIHGNKKNPKKKVRIIFTPGEDQIKVSVTDQGKGFDLNKISNPLDPKNLMKESGRGIFILKTLMDEVSFSFSPKGTTVNFVMKKRKQANTKNK